MRIVVARPSSAPLSSRSPPRRRGWRSRPKQSCSAPKPTGANAFGFDKARRHRTAAGHQPGRRCRIADRGLRRQGRSGRRFATCSQPTNASSAIAEAWVRKDHPCPLAPLCEDPRSIRWRSRRQGHGGRRRSDEGCRLYRVAEGVHQIAALRSALHPGAARPARRTGDRCTSGRKELIRVFLCVAVSLILLYPRLHSTKAASIVTEWLDEALPYAQEVAW